MASSYNRLIKNVLDVIPKDPINVIVEKNIKVREENNS
jgi:hypothetical protein